MASLAVFPQNHLAFKRYALFFSVFCFFQAAICLLFSYNPVHILLLLIFLSVSLLVANNFKISIYILIISMFVKYSVNVGASVRFFNLASVLLVLSYLFQKLASGKEFVKRTPLDKPIILFMMILGLSLINSVDLSVGIKTYLWHLQTVIIFYIVASSIEYSDIKKMLVFFLIVTLIHSIYDIIVFVLAEGKIRYMGLAGASIGGFTLVSLIICYSFFIYQKYSKGKIYMGIATSILLCGLITTQTRGAYISLIPCFIFITMIAMWKAKKIGSKFVIRNIVWLSLFIIATILVFIFSFPSFVHRLGYGHQMLILPRYSIDTTQLRYFLWDLSLKSFLRNPVLGIGLGQFYSISEIIPGLKLNVLSQLIKGLDPHNTILYYLSQTGIVGLGSFLYLLLSSFSLLLAKHKNSVATRDLRISTALLGFLFYVIISSLYAGEWFYGVGGGLLALFLGLGVVFKPNFTH
jgi:O-antigen ligase